MPGSWRGFGDEVTRSEFFMRHPFCTSENESFNWQCSNLSKTPSNFSAALTRLMPEKEQHVNVLSVTIKKKLVVSTSTTEILFNAGYHFQYHI